MTEQHHALRLLNKVCYTEERFTPFIVTSPLNKMGHGHYHDSAEKQQKKFISLFVRSNDTAYTEFGNPCATNSESWLRRQKWNTISADIKDFHYKLLTISLLFCFSQICYIEFVPNFTQYSQAVRRYIPCANLLWHIPNPL